MFSEENLYQCRHFVLHKSLMDWQGMFLGLCRKRVEKSHLKPITDLMKQHVLLPKL
jgi:hypothetical protein